MLRRKEMDKALQLKHAMKDGTLTSFEAAKPYLDGSELFQKLLKEFEENNLNLLHRLIELAEIPFSYKYKKVQNWRDKLAELTFCGEGFSLSGKKNDLLACYNAMITTVLMKLNYPDYEKIEKGIWWIVNYQNTARNIENKWPGKGIQKYGGCMKSTPCYIGVVKSMVSLSEFRKNCDAKKSAINLKLSQGLEYILEHKVYKRKRTDMPITKDMTKLTYPFTYKTNVVEILGLLGDNQMLYDQRSGEARTLVLQKRKKEGCWRINSHYKPKYWVEFDSLKQPAEWLTFRLKEILG